jgi:hypothetical protein
MSNVLEAAKRHYSDLIDGELKFLDVPEWQVDGKPTRIYYRQYMSVEEKGDLVKLYNQDSHYEMMVMSLIHSARNEDGSKMFKKPQRFDLKLVSAEVIRTFLLEWAFFSKMKMMLQKSNSRS